jgi:hypothetical protein
LIVDRNDIRIDKSFFYSDVVPLEKEIYEAMSIGGWIDSIFNSNSNKVNNYWFT